MGNKLIAFFCLFFGIIVDQTSGLNIQGLEHITYCNVYNKKCIMQQLEPQFRNWMKSGQPKYNIDGIETIYREHLDIPVNDGIYILNKVRITGADNGQLEDVSFQHNGVNGDVNYTYTFNLEVTAESFYKVDYSYNKISSEQPLRLRLNIISAVCEIPLHYEYDNTLLHMILEPETVRLRHPRNNWIVFDKSTPKFAQNEAFENGLVGIIGVIAVQAINSAYRSILAQNDVNNFIELQYYKV